MKTKYLWVAMGLLVVLSLLLVSCSGGGTTTSTTAPTSSTTAPTSTTSAPTGTTSVPTTTTTNPPTSTTGPTTTATTPAGGPKRGGTLKVVIGGNPTNIGIPWEANAPTDLWFICPAVETLFRTDSKGVVTPWLASGYTIAPDYSSFTITLNKGIKFQDGTAFDATAVKYNFDQQIAAPGVTEFKNATSVEVVDQYTVKVNVKPFAPQIFSLLAVGRPGWMVSPTYAKAHTADEMRIHPVGTGPFKFDSYTRDVSVKFTRFDGYWQSGKPYLDGVQYDIVADNTTGVIAFRSGGEDVNYNMTPKDANDVKNMGYNVTAAPASIYQWIPDSANASSPWSNVDVRRAAQYAIDTVAMAKAQGYGYADPYWNQVFPKGNMGYNPDIVGYPYNPAKAKELLTKAGYPNGFKTSMYQTVPPVGDLEPACQNYWAAVGIIADIKPLPGASYTQANTQGWQNGLLRSQSVASLGADNGYQMTTYMSTPAKQWVSLVRPPDFQDLLNKANAEFDLAKRPALYQAVAKNIIDTNALIISTWGGYLVAGKQNYVKGDNIRTLWTMTWTPEDAWLDK